MTSSDREKSQDAAIKREKDPVCRAFMKIERDLRQMRLRRKARRLLTSQVKKKVSMSRPKYA